MGLFDNYKMKKAKEAAEKRRAEENARFQTRLKEEDDYLSAFPFGQLPVNFKRDHQLTAEEFFTPGTDAYVALRAFETVYLTAFQTVFYKEYTNSYTPEELSTSAEDNLKALGALKMAQGIKAGYNNITDDVWESVANGNPFPKELYGELCVGKLCHGDRDEYAYPWKFEGYLKGMEHTFCRTFCDTEAIQHGTIPQLVSTASHTDKSIQHLNYLDDLFIDDDYLMSIEEVKKMTSHTNIGTGTWKDRYCEKVKRVGKPADIRDREFVEDELSKIPEKTPDLTSRWNYPDYYMPVAFAMEIGDFPDGFSFFYAFMKYSLPELQKETMEDYYFSCALPRLKELGIESNDTIDPATGVGSARMSPVEAEYAAEAIMRSNIGTCYTPELYFEGRMLHYRTKLNLKRYGLYVRALVESAKSGPYATQRRDHDNIPEGELVGNVIAGLTPFETRRVMTIKKDLFKKESPFKYPEKMSNVLYVRRLSGPKTYVFEGVTRNIWDRGVPWGDYWKVEELPDNFPVKQCKTVKCIGMDCEYSSTNWNTFKREQFHDDRVKFPYYRYIPDKWPEGAVMYELKSGMSELDLCRQMVKMAFIKRVNWVEVDITPPDYELGARYSETMRLFKRVHGLPEDNIVFVQDIKDAHPEYAVLSKCDKEGLFGFRPVCDVDESFFVLPEGIKWEDVEYTVDDYIRDYKAALVESSKLPFYKDDHEYFVECYEGAGVFLPQSSKEPYSASLEKQKTVRCRYPYYFQDVSYDDFWEDSRIRIVEFEYDREEKQITKIVRDRLDLPDDVEYYGKGKGLGGPYSAPYERQR